MKLEFLKMKIESFRLDEDLTELEYDFDHIHIHTTESKKYFQNKIYAMQYRVQVLDNAILDYKYKQLLNSLLRG